MSPRIRRVQQLVVPAAPLVGRYGLFRERLEVRSNDVRVLAAAGTAFGRFEMPATGDWLVLRIVVEGDRRGDWLTGSGLAAGATPAAAPSPGVRAAAPAPEIPGAPAATLDARDLVHDTAGHLFSITLGSQARAVVDVAGGFGSATISESLADDTRMLRYAVIEAMAQAMLTGGRGYVPIHASCVVRDGRGVILQAAAGTGKSTLALACARHGWGLLAEDVVFARSFEATTGGPEGASAGDARDARGVPDSGLESGPDPAVEAGLELWGMPWTQRLLPDAPRFFPDLEGSTARLQANGEHKLEVDLDSHAPGRATPRALAGPVVLLARGTRGPTRAEWLDPDDASLEVQVLWPWEVGWTSTHERTAVRLLDHGVLRLHLNSTPAEAVDVLEAALAAGPERLVGTEPGAPRVAGGDGAEP